MNINFKIKKMNDFTKGQLTESCQAVFRGSKPAANMPIKILDTLEAKSIIIQEECEFTVKRLSEGWNELWIYKDSAIKLVIQGLPNKPKTATDHFLLGSIFGYSNESILAFIKKEYEL